MIGLVIPGVAATACALATGGSFAAWSRVKVRWWLLLVLAFAVELVVYNPPVDHQPWATLVGPWLWLAARLSMAAVALRNAHPHGRWSAPWLVMLIGLAMNGLVIAANAGYMPQSPAAAAAVWGADYVRPDTYASRLENVTWMTADTRLNLLGDILAEPSWVPHPNVISLGDTLLALGMASWTFGLTRAGRRELEPA
jgi:uncharacterized protein DUF5317